LKCEKCGHDNPDMIPKKGIDPKKVLELIDLPNWGTLDGLTILQEWELSNRKVV
jgi:hypothetical protein